MPDLHNLLGDEAERREPSQQTPFEDLVRSHRRRQLRRRTFGAGVVATAAAVVGLIVITGPGPRNVQEVTSVNPSATPTVPAVIGLIPACSVADVSASASGGGPVSNGQTGATIILRNTGDRACTLPNHATTMSDLDQTPPLKIPVTHFVGTLRGGYVLRPGTYAAFYISSNWVRPGQTGCAQDQTPATVVTPHRLAIGLPGTGAVRVALPNDGAFTLACWPVSVGSVYELKPADLPVVSPTVSASADPIVCSVGDLRAKIVTGGYSGGADFGTLVAWNTSPRPCLIAGGVHYAAYYANGSRDRLAIPNRIPKTVRVVLPGHMVAYQDGADFAPYLSASLNGFERDDPHQPSGLCRTQDELAPSVFELTIGNLRLRVANHDPNGGLFPSVYGCHGEVLLESVHGPR